jgi:hypothetical protein
MAVEGIEYVYLETRDFGKSARFWQRLGFELVLDLGTSGKLEPREGGAAIFLEEVSPETLSPAASISSSTIPQWRSTLKSRGSARRSTPTGRRDCRQSEIPTVGRS